QIAFGPEHRRCSGVLILNSGVDLSDGVKIENEQGAKRCGARRLLSGIVLPLIPESAAGKRQ
ncbi:hypothetical protein, partial [Stieleria sp.]|uniref:hypothetical protein n=1 Tax=Stieleria sp. TaxID=2795976 RepID=UPI0035690E60